MSLNKTELLQIRIDAELLARFKRYSTYEGLHVSVAIRRMMINTCSQFESYIQRLEAEHQRHISKK